MYFKITIVLLFVLFCISGCSAEAAGDKITDDQKQMLAFGAGLATRNKIGYDSLQAGLKSDAMKNLREYWKVTDEDTAKETLNWLLAEGNRAQADKLMGVIETGEEFTLEESVEELYKDIKEKYIQTKKYIEETLNINHEQMETLETLSAYDYDRAVTLARLCYTAEYINEEDAWKFIETAVKSAQNDYTNWEEYFAGIVLGRTMIYGTSAEDNAKPLADALLNNEDSIWNKFPFTTEQ